MATAYTSLLGLALPVTGELSGTWGATVNDEITALLDSAVAGTTSITADADITLSDTDGAANETRQAVILWNPATGTTTRNITAPARSKAYIVINASGGTQSIVLRGAGPTTGVTIIKGEKALCAWNGSDFVKVANQNGIGNFTTVEFADGTAAAPSITNDGDTNTGIFFPAADTIAFSEGGAEAMRIDSSGNLLVGATTTRNRLTVGTASSSSSAPTLGTASGAALFSNNASTSEYGLMMGSASAGQGWIQQQRVDGTATAYDLWLQPSGGNLLVNTTNAGVGGLSVSNAKNINFAEDATSAYATLFRQSSSAALCLNYGLQIGTGADTWASSIGSATARSTISIGPGTIKFFTDTSSTVAVGTNITPTERARIDSSGNLGLGVTPSAFGGTNGGAIQMGAGYTSLYSYSNAATLGSNVYYNAGNKYFATGVASSAYQQAAGVHYWLNAPSGTAGNTISFTQAMTLDASGRLGIGTTSPLSTLVVSNGSNENIEFVSGNVSLNGGAIQYINRGTASTRPDLNYYLSSGGGAHKFYTNELERARIDSSGNLLVGTTSQPVSGITTRLGVVQSVADYSQVLNNTNATPYGIYIKHNTDSNGTGNAFIVALGNAADRFVVRSNGGIANYSANNVNLSDRREKTNFSPATSYLDKICSIPVQTFNYLDQNLEQDGGLTLGVVAQDVQAVAPELVMESNWAGKDEEPKMRLSIYQTDLQYALMKCIQEQQALITTLTDRITALEQA